MPRCCQPLGHADRRASPEPNPQHPAPVMARRVNTEKGAALRWRNSHRPDSRIASLPLCGISVKGEVTCSLFAYGLNSG